jgi:NTP pyrophosphatase (non-canonical NTP hydrolase)
MFTRLGPNADKGKDGRVVVPTLESAKKKVGDLVVKKGFGNTPSEIPNKLLFAFIELGEAGDSWKKGKPKEETIEELIDVIFYVLDASRLIDPSADLDEVFNRKLAKNLSRPHHYGEGFRPKP